MGGLQLLALSLVLGGVAWAWLVLVPWRGGAPPAAVRRCVAILGAGAVGVAAGQVVALGLRVVVLAGLLGADVFEHFRETLAFRAGVAQAALGLVLALATAWLARAPAARERWTVVGVLALLVAASGAWLVHAAARLEGRAPLMAFTVAHEVGGAVWVGGLLHLAATWRLARRDVAVAGAWPALVARFSRVAITSIVVLALAAVPLTVSYVGSWDALVGSGYGSYIVAKAALMAGALLLGGLSFLAGRRAGAAVRTRVPYLIEAEAVLLVTVLFAAASLSAQPPPVDTAGERATWAEVVEVFRPKWPALRTPSIDVMLAQDALAAGSSMAPDRTREAYLWSNFSHNVAGLLLLPMGVAALVAAARPRSWARHWPAGFLALAAFVFLRTSANDGIWPFGPVGFWESLGDAEVLQHRLGALLAVVIGAIEWRARAGGRRGLGYVFPFLAAAGGVLLLTHAHAAFEIKSAYLVQVTHTAMGVLAVAMAVARLLELRLPAPASRVAGVASTAAMVVLALVLIFYREANVVTG